MIRYGNRAEAAAHFARELQSQDWTQGSSWAGESTAGSSWSKQRDGKQSVFGLMQLLDLGKGELLVEFSALRLEHEPDVDALGKRDPQALNSLIFQGSPDKAIPVSRQVPPENSGFRLPRQFTLIGTASVWRSEKTTAFRTSLPILRARDAVLEAMAAAGWKQEMSTEPEEVFLIPNRSRFDIVCRGGDRRVIRVHEIDDVRYVAILVPDSSNASRSECQNPGMQAWVTRASTLRSSTPKLNFPESVLVAPGSVTTNTQLSGRLLTYRTRIRSLDSPARIVEHLAPQLASQGWKQEGAWSSLQSAGSAWKGLTESGTPIWSDLQIISLGNALFDLRMQLTLYP